MHAKQPTSKKHQPSWRDGHRFGTLCCASVAGLVLLTNDICAVVIARKYRVVDSIAVLQHGTCSTIKSLNQWLHLLISVLSTALLGPTSYCMRCLTAPARRDINQAHQQHKWMDIGVPSVRNVLLISWLRKLLWCLLLLSSIPIHLIYNSVIYIQASLSAKAKSFMLQAISLR